ncbi:DUF4922 domain-containing protein [Bacteroides reticulotermitis]|uniref:DUF4922 domain-containing protein n=1 Tax=Bacteroides reticulotermitis TaxID=1133319 RepID=UPI003A856E0F
MKENIQTLLAGQLSTWELAKLNYKALEAVRTKEFQINNANERVQFNPARILSSAAKVDATSIRERKCFLCTANRPAIQQRILFGEKYQILVNPYPIFPQHLTIPDVDHLDQRIEARFNDMLDLAEAIDNFVIFYNGPQCGASAPDHAHFQAGNKGFLPIESEWKAYRKEEIKTTVHASIQVLDSYPRTALIIEATHKQEANHLFECIYKEAFRIRSMDNATHPIEPMMNILTWKEAEKWITVVFLRSKHRPSCFTEQGENNLLISPASVDLGGVWITPQEKDFEKITAETIHRIIEEVSLPTDDFLQLIERIKGTK